jgi:hypothetical protein
VHNRVAGGVAAMILAGAVAVAAQAPAAVDASRVHDLLVLIESADQSAALDAATDLERIGPSVAPALVESLKTHPGCQPQWVASGVLARLELEAALVESTLLQVARGTCRPSSVADLRLQQDAAFAVIDRVRGISLMAELLRGDDQLARYRAAFAFDELTERLVADHPRAIAATPEIVAATEAALPLLRNVAVSKANVRLRCLSYEALDQARRLPIDALRARATKLLDGVASACEPAAGAPPPAVTREVRRESLEEAIAGLDRQPSELAAKASSALVAAGDEVEPLLRKRLQQTNRCRGLALVAGILASRNVAAADVEAAFTRVVEGKCDGREPFDLLLAESVAAAYMMRPDGIAKMAQLLAHRDVTVRRRAAEAFGTLFERLGSGEHARAVAIDPALVAPARAALEPLVAFATTERDQQARCLAVRALLHAQQAANDDLRADAVAATAGRTIRCLAPPNP